MRIVDISTAPQQKIRAEISHESYNKLIRARDVAANIYKSRVSQSPKKKYKVQNKKKLGCLYFVRLSMH